MSDGRVGNDGEGGGGRWDEGNLAERKCGWRVVRRCWMVFGVSVFLSHCLLSVLVGVQIRAGEGGEKWG